MILGDDSRLKKRWRRRRIVMGCLGFFLTVLTLVSWGLELFKEDERYSTVVARETMEDRTDKEVGISQEDFNRRDLMVSTVPPPLSAGSHRAEAALQVDHRPGLDPEGLRKPEVSVRSSGSDQSNPSDEHRWVRLGSIGAVPPEFMQSIAARISQPPDSVAGEQEPEPYSNPHVNSPALPDEMFDTVMLIGADASGKLADSILLGLFPEDGSPPALVSIPRDLYLPNPCTKDYRRVNASLWGCRDGVSGPELLAVMVEDFTGVAVDHYVLIDFEGFVEVVDELGGVEICFEFPTHDRDASLDIPEAGCLVADGATALAYARSRKARQLVDGEWRSAWSSDTVRQRHQREILLDVAANLKEASLVDLVGSFQSLAHAFRLDSGWSVAEALEWAWRYRDLDLSTVTHLVVAVDSHQTPYGELVVVPARPFNETLSQWWGEAAR